MNNKKSVSQTNYTIFISYRRDGAFETASLIAEKLRNAGYKVFLDVESLRSGKFNEQLYAVIEQCTDFILILPKDGLERCANEGDWLRLEVLCAMQHNKNIIPVMLNGFTWPQVMPEELKGLNEYQSIAAGGHEYFDASVDRLKRYLKSKPNSWSTKKLRWLAIIAIAVCVCIGALYYGLKMSAIPICKEQTDKMTSKMAVINLLVSEAKAINEAWANYYNRYAQASPSDTAYINQEIRKTLDFHFKEIQKLQKDTATFILNDYQRAMLQLQKVDITDIEVFHHTLFPSFFDDIYNSIEVLERYLQMGDVPQISTSTSKVNAEYFQYSANAAYYGYLQLLSSMPDKVLENYTELSTYWLNLPSSTSLHLPKTEYNRLQKLEEEKANALISQLGYLNTEQSLKLEQEQKKLDLLKEKVETRNRTEAEIKARTQHVMKLSAEVLEKQKKLQETADRIDASIKRSLDKFELSAEDDQYLMWGKIIRIGKLMATTQQSRKQAKLLNEQDKEAAKAKGYDVSNWYEVSYSITTHDLLKEILKRLDQYMAYFPETKSYVPQVKKFFTGVEAGKYPLQGMVVIATKDNLKHPVVELGDIVTARKGMIVNNTDDYKKAKDKEGDDSLTILRSDNYDNLKKITKLVPQTDVLVGFLVLKEEE